MDESQVTGAASSYARKYALNGLLAIDDTKDADTMDNTKEGTKRPQTAPKTAPETNSGEVCPKCGKPVIYKTAGNGKSFWKCTGSIWRAGKEMGCDYIKWDNADDDFGEFDIDRGDQQPKE